MAHPIAYGVDKAIRARRRNARAAPPPGRARAWWYFVAITGALSWLTAAALGSPPDDLVGASLHYAATMGWTPLVGAWLARWSRDDDAAPIRLRLRDLGGALGMAAAIAGGAIGVAWLAGEVLRFDATPLGPALGATAILCAQSVTEEHGWRGYPLTCAIEQWGSRIGLVVHGIAWGVWYAPLFLIASERPSAAYGVAAGFALTCILLGIVLGWLRARTDSTAPPALVNAVLTVIAGLPLWAGTGGSGARDAIFRWPGWIVIGALAVILLARPCRASRSSSSSPTRSSNDRG